MFGGHTWQWELLQPHREDAGDAVPCPRELPGGMLAHGGHLFLFGGGTLKYGRAKGPGDLAVLGSLDDLWRFSLDDDTWLRLEEDDDRAGYAYSDTRPCGRILPVWVPVNDRLYLFGGLSVLGAGWRPHILNDLWRYDPTEGDWELLEPDDGRTLRTPVYVDGDRPATVSAMGAATIGTRIYVFGGWAGALPKRDRRSGQWSWFSMSPQLWCYDTVAATWDR